MLAQLIHSSTSKSLSPTWKARGDSEKPCPVCLSLTILCLSFYLPHLLLLTYRFTWAQLPSGVKARFFSPWLALIFLGVASTIASVYIDFLYSKSFAPSVKLHKVFAGLGCLLLWTTVLRYLEHHPTFYALVSTFNAAVPRLLPFLSGFIPIFIGYTVLGMSLFGRTDSIFSTVPKVRKKAAIAAPRHTLYG